MRSQRKWRSRRPGSLVAVLVLVLVGVLVGMGAIAAVSDGFLCTDTTNDDGGYGHVDEHEHEHGYGGFRP